ncbi:hypothetical protein JZ785_10580 [Alicyclobacillus curvatus]|nr:hypothetical protein JZ785_10580 [Alicyclobacillus curvatus]
MWTHSLAQVVDAFQHLVNESAPMEGYQIRENALLQFLSENPEQTGVAVNTAKLMGFFIQDCDDDDNMWIKLDWERIGTEYINEFNQRASLSIVLQKVDWDNQRLMLGFPSGDELVTVPLILGQVGPGEKEPAIVYRSTYIREIDGFYSWLDVLFVEETCNQFIEHVNDKLHDTMKGDYIELLNGTSLSNVDLTKIEKSIQKYLCATGFTYSADRQQMRKMIPFYQLPESTRLYWNYEYSLAVFSDASRLRALTFDSTGQMTRAESVIEHISNVEQALNKNLNEFLDIKAITDSNIFAKDKLTAWIPAAIVMISSVLGVLFKILHWDSVVLTSITTAIVVVLNVLTLLGVFMFGIIPNIRLALFSWDIR